MTQKQRDRVRDLAFLKWELAANHSAKADGLITVSMYEFARDALQKEIAVLEKLCNGTSGNGGDNGGAKVHTAGA